MKHIFNVLAAIFLLLAALMNEGCTIIDKEGFGDICESDCTIIQGKFTTEIGEPARNVRLTLQWESYPSAGIGLGGKIRKIMRTRTNENGNYEFVFHVKDEELMDGYFKVTFYPPDTSYIILESSSSFFFFGIDKRDTVITADCHLPKRGGEIEVRLKNPEAITGDDRLSTQIYYRYCGSGRILTETLYSEVASNVLAETAANQYTYLDITKKVNGQFINTFDSVLVPLNQKVIYEVEF
jgi:hypothetical protein